MSELADACGQDVFSVRDRLESMGLLSQGKPTSIAFSHGFAEFTTGDGGREYAHWHPDTIFLLGGVRASAKSELFEACAVPASFHVFDRHTVDCDERAVDYDEHMPEIFNDQHMPDDVSEYVDDVSENVLEAGALSGAEDNSGETRSIGKLRPGFDAIIATDGACSGNPGPGGWAWVEQISGARDSGGESHTTNNIMELTAMIRALEYVEPHSSLLIRADSQYVINVMTKWAASWRRKGWKKADGKPVANRELVERLLELYEGREAFTEVEWVKGHAGDEANELVDSLAVEESRKYAN